MTEPILWQCDGCGLVTDDETTATRVHDDCPDHWGWMVVGGVAWNRFTFEGIHPMTQLVDEIAKNYLRHVLDLGDLLGLEQEWHPTPLATPDPWPPETEEDR